MIRNIIFDFGGVIYDIDHHLNKLAFEKLGISDFENLYGHQIQDSLFEDFERGWLSKEEFHSLFNENLNRKIPLEAFSKAWCSLLIGVQKEKIELLQRIAKHYKIFLLSNTTIIHYEHFMKELNVFTDFRSLFNGIYFSHEHGMRKPEDSFYLKLIQENSLKASECLFIDDLDVNIKAAKKLGLQTYYLHHKSLFDLFEEGKWKKENYSPRY